MDQSMIGLIAELFETMDPEVGMAALQQQVDKGDVDAMLTLGFFYMYHSLPADPLKAFSYFDLACQKHHRYEGWLIRAMYEDTPYVADHLPEVLAAVFRVLSDMIPDGSLMLVKHLVWLEKRFSCQIDGAALLKRLDELMPDLSGDDLYEARLLYGELLGLPGISSSDLSKAKLFWEGLLNSPIRPDTAKRALSLHFHLHSELLSESVVCRLIGEAERKGYPIALYKGYWQLSRGALKEAFKTFEKGYALNEFHCDLALAYCHANGYGTVYDPEQALTLCRDECDKEAQLMWVRICLTHDVEGSGRAWPYLEDQAFDKKEPRMIAELILQRHVHYGYQTNQGALLREAVSLGLNQCVPLAFSYPYQFPDKYDFDLKRDLRGSIFLSLSEYGGSHPLNDYQLAQYYKGTQEDELAAPKLLRVLYDPNVSLRFRKAVAEELVAGSGSLDGGYYFDRVLEWWNNLDPQKEVFEHRFMEGFYQIHQDLDNPASQKLFQTLKTECVALDRAEPFVFYMIGLIHRLPGELNDAAEAKRFLLMASEVGYYPAFEQLLFAPDEWNIDKNALFERMNFAEGPRRRFWAVREAAGAGFPALW